jgi:hypothetical protein
MIQANELRIGNLVQIEIDDEIYYTKVEGIKKSEVSLSLSIRGYKWDDLEDIDPIPITHEILEKAGFEKKLLNQYFYPGGFQLSLFKIANYSGDAYFDYDSNEGYLRLLSSDGGDTSSVIEKIQFLHQLQNIYFALAGEELKVNF